MTVIDEVKQKTDIVEVISQYATLTKAGRTFRALCPFHSEKHPSFFVYPEQQSWHCFGACSTGGDVFSFVMKKNNIDFGEALRLLAERAGITIPSRFDRDTRKDEKEKLYQANQAAAQYFHNLLLNSPQGEEARNYLSKRGFSSKTVTDFQLGFSLNSWEALQQYLMERSYTENELLEAGLIVASEEGKTHDRFRNRLMFPIHDARGRTTGFGARVLDDSLPKYINSKGKDPDDIIREDVKSWQQIVGETLLPIVDYTFNMVISELDLTEAKDKSLAAERLLPIIAEMKDTVRRAHYLRKLASLTDIDERSLGATLRMVMVSQDIRRAIQPTKESVTRAVQPLVSSALEEYCLALLLQHPELKNRSDELLPEYFQNSENREIFVAWQQITDLTSLKEKLDPAIWDKLDYLATRSLLSDRIESKYADCVLRLREEFLRGLEMKRAAIFSQEAETGGTAAELAKLEEQGIEVSAQLGELFARKAREVRSKKDDSKGI